MKTQTFKTNIKCAACVAKVTPALDEIVGHDKWKVDLNSPSRTLITEEAVDEAKLKEALQKVGYNAERQ